MFCVCYRVCNSYSCICTVYIIYLFSYLTLQLIIFYHFGAQATTVLYSSHMTIFRFILSIISYSWILTCALLYVTCVFLFLYISTRAGGSLRFKISTTKNNKELEIELEPLSLKSVGSTLISTLCFNEWPFTNQSTVLVV